MTEMGRRITRDWTSVRDAPPVKKRSAKNVPSIQNIGDGLPLEERIVDKTDLVCVTGKRGWAYATKLYHQFWQGR